MRNTAIKLGIAAACCAVLYIMGSLTTSHLHSQRLHRQPSYINTFGYQDNSGTLIRPPVDDDRRKGETELDEVRYRSYHSSRADDLRLPQRSSSTSTRPSPVVVNDVVHSSEPGTTSTTMKISGDDAPKDAEQAAELAPPEYIAGHSNVARLASEEIRDNTDDRSHSMPTQVRCVKFKGPPKYDPALACRKRLPHVIGIGVEKCGSAAMTFYLRMHPNVAHSVTKELYYWNNHADESLDWYRSLMPVSSKYQVTMEFTPSYIFGRDVPTLIKERAPDTKFILMVRDPVDRAMSHFLHVQYYRKRQSSKAATATSYLPLEPGKPARVFLNDTFETTVVEGGDGDVLEGNAIVENGLYDVHLQRWFDVFPRDRFLVVDEGEFSKDPIPSLRRVEEFLDLPPFFNQDLIYFDEKRGLFCRARPKHVCLSSSKGRTHPDIRDDVVQKLTDFYRPHNLRLNSLLNQNFSWTYEK